MASCSHSASSRLFRREIARAPAPRASRAIAPPPISAVRSSNGPIIGFGFACFAGAASDFPLSAGLFERSMIGLGVAAWIGESANAAAIAEAPARAQSRLLLIIMSKQRSESPRGSRVIGKRRRGLDGLNFLSPSRNVPQSAARWVAYVATGTRPPPDPNAPIEVARRGSARRSGFEADNARSGGASATF